MNRYRVTITGLPWEHQPEFTRCIATGRGIPKAAAWATMLLLQGDPASKIFDVVVEDLGRVLAQDLVEDDGYEDFGDYHELA